MQPLRGITVVAVEQAVAAPICTRHRGDLGARVIKVESRAGGDFARGYDQVVNGLSAYFAWANRNKESVALPGARQERLAGGRHPVRRRAADARARRGLATDPAVLLLDELSMGLAPVVVSRLYEHVAEIARQGVAVLLVEQFATAALSIADHAAVLVRGRVALQGPPDAALRAELSDLYLGSSR